MRILYVGEIVGRAGVFTLKKLLPLLKRERAIDVTIACADGATGGAGIGKAHSIYIRKLGVDILTTGDCCFYKKDIVEHFPKAPWMLRPANYPPGVPGRGFKVHATPAGELAVIQLLGQSGFSRVHLGNPFHFLDDILDRLKRDASPERPAPKTVLVDFHAATTAEKRTLFRYADGRVSAIVGSHGRVLTADASVSHRGTASITDAGRTGSLMSVGGMDAQTRINEFLSGVPVWARDANLGLTLQGCVIETDPSGKAVSIEAIRTACKEVLHDRTGNSDED